MIDTGKWAIPAATLCLGLAIGSRSLTAPAAAAGGGVAPVERLLIESEIRNKLALYAFYADGDGIGGRPRDVARMAETLMTPDVVSEIHLADGSPPIVRTGRPFVAASKPDADPARAGRIAGRHYNVSTAFDSITPATVETRTDAVYFDATRTTAADCVKARNDTCLPQQPVKTVMWVYHMTWKKTPDGWQIARNVLRDDN